jgi:hypothetical protein
VAVDQRVPELPLRAGDLKAVALESTLARPALPELLALGDELRDPRLELVRARTGPAPPKTGRPQVPQ